MTRPRRQKNPRPMRIEPHHVIHNGNRIAGRGAFGRFYLAYLLHTWAGLRIVGVVLLLGVLPLVLVPFVLVLGLPFAALGWLTRGGEA